MPGTALGAVPLATALSLWSGLPSVFVRVDAAKDHGTSKSIEGVLNTGDRVLLVEDVVTTGGASLTAVDLLVAAGATVAQVVAVVDREQGGREKFVERRGAVRGAVHRHELGLGGNSMSNDLRKLGVITPVRRRRAALEGVLRGHVRPDLEFEDDTSAVMKMENLLLNLVVRGSAPELIEPAPVAASGAGSKLMFTIWVDDVDALAADLTARGLALLNGPIDRPWGVRTVAFADPDGHAWELAQQIGG